ncbi:hypothetical protein KAX02_06400 [candidate division WOR-3 bacterium]|nr:hypothetical protein [candidate division WOR-3 bacterium]
MSGKPLTHGDIAEMAEEYEEKKKDTNEKVFKEAKETGRTIAEDLLEQGVNVLDLIYIGQEIILAGLEKCKKD